MEIIIEGTSEELKEFLAPWDDKKRKQKEEFYSFLQDHVIVEKVNNGYIFTLSEEAEKILQGDSENV